MAFKGFNTSVLNTTQTNHATLQDSSMSLERFNEAFNTELCLIFVLAFLMLILLIKIFVYIGESIKVRTAPRLIYDKDGNLLRVIPGQTASYWESLESVWTSSLFWKLLHSFYGQSAEIP